MTKLSLVMVVAAGIYPLVDPDSKAKLMPGQPKEVELTPWVQGQLNAGNLKLASAEAVEANLQTSADDLTRAEEALADKQREESEAAAAQRKQVESAEAIETQRLADEAAAAAKLPNETPADTLADAPVLGVDDANADANAVVTATEKLAAATPSSAATGTADNQKTSGKKR